MLLITSRLNPKTGKAEYMLLCLLFKTSYAIPLGYPPSLFWRSALTLLSQIPHIVYVRIKDTKTDVPWRLPLSYIFKWEVLSDEQSRDLQQRILREQGQA